MTFGALHRPVSRWCLEVHPLILLEFFAVHLWILQPYCTAFLLRSVDGREGANHRTCGQHPELLIGIFLGQVNVNRNLEFGRESMTGDAMMLTTAEEKWFVDYVIF